MFLLQTTISCTITLFVFAQKNPHFVNDKNTIVHLFEWKFSDVAKECENFLQYHDYGGVQVSPVSENVIIKNRPWYERYQPISYKIISRSGGESDFREMTKRCNKVGIRVYVDVILNHMTSNTTQKVLGVGGSTATPKNYDFPAVPYNKSDFHSNCASNNDPVTTRNCQLVGLLDLNQTTVNVKNKMVAFLNKLTSLGAAGFRIDAANHMWPNDLEKIYHDGDDLNFEFPPNSRPFIYQEVTDLVGGKLSKFEYTPIGVVTEFNASVSLGRTFMGINGTKLSTLKDYGVKWGFVKSDDGLVFVDNHHNQRGHGIGGSNILTYKTKKLYVMANAFLLAHPYGITRIMSSYNFEDASEGPPQYKNSTIISPKFKNGVCVNGWICEHRWPQIYKMVAFRRFVKGTPINNWWSNGDQQIAFGRGSKGFVAFTNGGNIERKLQTKMTAGVYCDIISGKLHNGACTGKSVTVDGDGDAFVELLANESEGVVAIQANLKRTSILVNEEPE